MAPTTELTGAEGPALLGDAFLKRWTNQPLGNLVGFEHSKMPATNPGSLPDNTMWTITAFVLQKNGFSSGSVALNQQTGASRTLAKRREMTHGSRSTPEELQRVNVKQTAQKE